MRPTEEQYHALKAVLVYMKTKYNAAEQENEIARLEAGLGQLRALFLYLQNDPEIADNFLLRPLAALESALFDSGRGANPALLDHVPERPGRPAGLARESVQGSLAFAVQLLVVGGVGTEAACKLVADIARRLGVRAEDGGALTGRQIKSWRAEISREKAPRGACETFAKLHCLPPYNEAFRPERRLQPLPRQWHEKSAGAVVKALAATAPRSGPNANRHR